MFTFGVLGIAQVLFIPGLLIKKFLKLPQGFWMKTASIIALSLIANYILVFLAVIIGIFSQYFVLIIFAIEMVLLIRFYGTQILSVRLDAFLKQAWNRFIDPLRALFPRAETDEADKNLVVLRWIFSVLFFVAALVAVEWIFRFFRYSLGEIFNVWDDVLSWNRWATDWALNRFPSGTEDYPQLIPTAWAMIYGFMGTTQIQFFSKAIMPLFPLLLMLVLLSLGIQHKQAGFFVGVVLLRLILKRFSINYLDSGYVDIPLAFFVLMSILYLWETAKSTEFNKKFHWWTMSVLLAAGASVVKQAGILMLGWSLVIGFILTFEKFTKKLFVEHWRKLVYVLLIIVILVLPWYAIKAVQFMIGVDNSHWDMIYGVTQEVHQKESALHTILPALRGLGTYGYVFLFVIPCLFFIPKFWRWIGILIVLPYTLIWAAFASYDTRNLTLLFPLYAILIGLGVEGMLSFTVKMMTNLKLGKVKVVWILALIVIHAMTGLSIRFPADVLRQQQTEKALQLFNPGLNQQLLDFFAVPENQGLVLTNYPMDYIPGLEGLKITDQFSNFERFLELSARSDIVYILYPTSADTDILNWIDQGINQNRYEIILTNPNWIPYTLVRVVPYEGR